MRRDVHEQQLERAEAKNVADLGLDGAFRECVDHEIEPRAPAKHTEDERADEAGVVSQKERREGRLPLDAAEELEGSESLVFHRPRAAAPHCTDKSVCATFGRLCSKRTLQCGTDTLVCAFWLIRPPSHHSGSP